MLYIQNEAPMLSLDNEKKQKEIWLKVLLFTYLFLLTWLILFKLGFSVRVFEKRLFNFIPFYNSGKFGFSFEAFANIVAFLPFGIYISMLKVNKWLSVLYGFLLSFFFEMVQLIFAIGVADVTDLITNTSGAVVGILIYMLFCVIFKNKKQLNLVLKIIFTVITAICFAVFFLFFAIELPWLLRS